MKKILQAYILLWCSILVAQEQPNILWIVCEDISPMLSFYDDDTAKTPNLDALAKENVSNKYWNHAYENRFRHSVLGEKRI